MMMLLRVGNTSVTCSPADPDYAFALIETLGTG